MSVYNGARFLKDSIDSILAQTFSDFELIIVNDGSTDGSAAILAQLVDPRVRVLVNETNIGLTASLNRGLDVSRGELIARQDADDLALPERLAAQVAFLDEHPEIGLIGTAYQVVDEAGRVIATHVQPRDEAILRWQLLFQNAFCHTSVMLRRKVIPAKHLYDANLAYAQDYDAWSRVMRVTKGYNLPEPLVRYRHHGNTISRKNFDAQQSIADSICSANLAFVIPSGGQLSAHASRLRAVFSKGPGGLSLDCPLEDVKLYLTVLAEYIRHSEISSSAASALWSRETRRFRRVTTANFPVPIRLRLWAEALFAERMGWEHRPGQGGEGCCRLSR